MIFTYPGFGQLTCKLYRDDWSNIVLSLSVIFFGLFMLFVCLEDYEITCQDKKQNLANGCTLRPHFFNIYKTRIDLGQLRGAEVVLQK